jgi:hypothetical protein
MAKSFRSNNSTCSSSKSVTGIEITQADLREAVYYDPETGEFRWATAGWRGKRVVGEIAGWVNADGYRVIAINGRSYYGHRLAFLYMKGEWPVGNVDHEDTDRSNNAWDNLRPASKSENGANRGANKNNSSGFKGVTWNRAIGKWQAQITLNRRHRVLGHFTDPETAHAAYLAAAQELHGEFARAE